DGPNARREHCRHGSCARSAAPHPYDRYGHPAVIFDAADLVVRAHPCLNTTSPLLAFSGRRFGGRAFREVQSYIPHRRQPFHLGDMTMKVLANLTRRTRLLAWWSRQTACWPIVSRSGGKGR